MIDRTSAENRILYGIRHDRSWPRRSHTNKPRQKIHPALPVLSAYLILITEREVPQ